MEPITVYTTPTCPWCTKMKAYLDQKGVAYQEADVAADADAAREMMEFTGQRSVPVLIKGDQYVIGFNQTELDRVLQ